MPFATVETSSGVSEFHYLISTPTSASAKSIDEDIPTVLLLHPVYVPQVIFQPQLIDRSLRRFNLVGVDSRRHGLTPTRPTGGFGPKDAAEDLFKVMENVNLPPCHIVGLSMGASIALELAVAHPEKVLSLVLLSTPPFDEPEDVYAGRSEIYQYWSEAIQKPEYDSDGLGMAVYGALQLMFNNETSSKVNAITKYVVPQNIINFDSEHLEDLRLATVDFFTQPKSQSSEKLARITCPVKMIHSSEDVAYPVQSSETIVAALRDAGVNASLQITEGPHFSCFSRPDIINPIIHDFLMSVVDTYPPFPPLPLVSPFDEELKQLGWDDDDEDGESEAEIEIVDVALNSFIL